MNLDTLDKRYELVKEMLDKAFIINRELSELSEGNKDYDNDWAGVEITLDNLTAIKEMMCVEEIFLDAFDEMQEVRTADRDEKESFIGIFYLDGLNVFNQEVLMPRLKHAKENLDSWGFCTEEGKEFYEEFSAKFNALIKKYDGLYDV